jgi:pimeloyl-ACP methyl ester carboxylesterase
MTLAPVRETYVDVNGAKVNYVVCGSGPTVIFVHGWACDASFWRFQVPVFARNYRVIAIDLPGHGKSTIPAQGFTMGLFAKALEAVRSEVAANRVVFVGHSLGCVVIREYALSYSEQLAGLVAADGPLDTRRFALRAGGQAIMSLAAREGLINRMLCPQTPEVLRAEITKAMLGASAVTANGAGAAMFNPMQSDRLITVPALTIYAGTPLFGLNNLTREVLPKWESSQIPETGHFVMMERPQEFNKMLADFLQNRAAY